MSGWSLFSRDQRIRLLVDGHFVPATVVKASLGGIAVRTEMRVGRQTLYGECFVRRADIARRVRVIAAVEGRKAS